MISALNERNLNDFDNGKMSDHQIYMMLINAIKTLEAYIEKMQMELDEVKNK